MIDSHCHLDKCPGDPDEVVGLAREAGIERILTVGLDDHSNRVQIDLAARFGEVFAAVGWHPNSANGFGDGEAAGLADAARADGVVAIGETGLDFYRDTASPESQRRAFEAQIDLAVETDLPLVVHLRDREGSDEAVSEAFETLDRRANGIGIVLHCFSAPDWVGRAAERGWFCSFAGNLTYPANERLREAAGQVPDDLLLVETDAPFLTPQTHRRERNQPAFVVETAGVLATARGTTTEEIDRLTTGNASRLFGW